MNKSCYEYFPNNALELFMIYLLLNIEYELYIWTLWDISHSTRIFYKIPKKKEKSKKKATTLIYRISNEKYNLEDFLKSDMDWHSKLNIIIADNTEISWSGYQIHCHHPSKCNYVT